MDQEWNRDRRSRPQSQQPGPRPGARGQGRPVPRSRPAQSETRRQSGSSKRTPRRRRGSLFPNPWMYLLFVFGVSAIMAALCWTAANDVLALNKEEGTGVITVTDDTSLSTVVNELKQQGLIEYKTLFHVFAFFMGADDKISQGTYKLNTDMDYRALINGMSGGSGDRMEVDVVITEGKTVDQIFQLLEEKGVTTVAKLQEVAANHDYAFSFLQVTDANGNRELPMGDYKRLEGFLFPDTYKFYMGENPLYVLNKMLVNFDAKVTDEIRTKIQEMGYTVRQMMTIASMVEKETDGTDRSTIASVIYNRLRNTSGGTQGYLQIDATINYVLPEGQTVKQEDYQTVDSPYNTYLHKGLPPGPIANPGMSSIYAAINPDNTNYYYYFHYPQETENGTEMLHHFSTTYAEHEAFQRSVGGQ